MKRVASTTSPRVAEGSALLGQLVLTWFMHSQNNLVVWENGAEHRPAPY